MPPKIQTADIITVIIIAIMMKIPNVPRERHKSIIKNRNIPQNKIGKIFKNNAGRVPKNAKII